MKNNKIIVLIIIIASIFVTTYLNAADRISLRALGMGRTAVAITRGTDAIGINPANLAIPDLYHFNINLINTNTRVSTELFSYDVYTKYFTGIDDGSGERIPYPLTDEDKNNIRNQMSETPLTSMNAESMIFGFSMEAPLLGGVGFAIIEHAGVSFALSRDFFDMMYLHGLPSNTKYNFDGTSFSGWWYREYNMSYATELEIKSKQIKDFYVGAGIKIIQGFGVFKTSHNNSSIENRTALTDTDLNQIICNFDFITERAGVDFFNKDKEGQSFGIFPDPVGGGFGVDLGMSTSFMNGMRFGFSITDIGSITWDKNVFETSGGGTYIYTGYVKNIEDSIDNALKGKTASGESFKTALPTTMRIGASIPAEKISFLKNIPGKLLLAVEYAQGLNESLGNNLKPRFSFGAEYKIIPFVPIRTGLLFGGGDDLRWSFGFGFAFRNFNFDLASDNFGYIFAPNNFKIISLSFGMKIKF